MSTGVRRFDQDPDVRAICEDVASFARRMYREKLVSATSGNISARCGDVVAITPTGLPYDQLTADLVGVHDLDGLPVDAPLVASSELGMHLAVYRETSSQAVVHTHSMFAMTMSTLVAALPPIHYMLALFGGEVKTVPYATYGSPELAQAAASYLADAHGALLQNHGAITRGEDLSSAYTRTVYLEEMCELYYRAKLFGDPNLLTVDQMDAVVAKLGGYGQPHPAQ